MGFLFSILIIAFNSKNCGEALQSFFTQTFTIPYYFGQMLNTQNLLLIAGLGQIFSVKGGNLNLGGEGQIYAGGLIASLVFISPLSKFPLLCHLTAIILCILLGFILTFPSAYLKETKKIEVLLTSFLLSSALIPIINSIISLWKRDGTQNLLALPYIEKHLRFKQLIPPSPFNASFIFAIFAVILAAFYLEKTFRGRKIEIFGIANEFALYAGYNSNKNTWETLSVCTILHTLTGYIAVAGTYYTCHQGFYQNLGWSALTCALIANSNPLKLIVSTFFIAWLYTSCDRISLTQGFNFDISSILQGIILFFLALNFTLGKLKTRRTKEERFQLKKMEINKK